MKSPNQLALTFSMILLIAACGAPSATKQLKGTTSTTGSGGPLAIATLVPNSVPENSVPFTMIVNGDNFSPSAQLFWNNTPQFTVFVNPQQLQVSVTQTDLMFPGSAQVYVRDSGVNSNTLEFAVTF